MAIEDIRRKLDNLQFALKRAGKEPEEIVHISSLYTKRLQKEE